MFDASGLMKLIQNILATELWGLYNRSALIFPADTVLNRTKTAVTAPIRLGSKMRLYSALCPVDR